MIIFTNHALLKLEQRGISKSTVTKTLRLPDYKVSSHSGKSIAYKKFNKLYLRVIYRIEGDNTIIITQYWEEKPKLIK